VCVCQYMSENLHLVQFWGGLRAFSAGVFSFAPNTSPMHTYQNTNQENTHTPLPYLRRSSIIVIQAEKKKVAMRGRDRGSANERASVRERERERERTRER